MNIGWLADNFYPKVQRGAEIEDNILIKEAERRGHKIFKIYSNNIIKDVDLYIVANCVDTFNIGELLGYLSQKPYINIEHDLRGPHYAWYKMFASEALINVYHSPYQKQFIEKISGKYNHFLHPMCIPEQFKDLKLERKHEADVLYVGDYSWEKGYKEMVEWLNDNPDSTIWHGGLGFPKKHPRMIEMGQIPQHRMPEVYNTFNSLIFLPAYPQACSRVIAEAYLCKILNIITNSKDGFTSYGWTMDDYDIVREKLINAHINFWNVIEKCQL